MDVFGVFFGRRGDAGFIGPLLWVCSGVVGFNVAVFLSPVRDVFRPASPAPAAVREKVRPAALWSSCRREKVRPAREKWLKMGVLCRVGRTSSRKCGWRGCAGRTSSRKYGWRGRAGRVFRGPAVVGSRRASLLCRVPGSRALLLAPLTLQCAAKPYWWHGGQPAQATTYRVNVRIKGVHACRIRSQKQKRA
mgnify:CR=1 FL=1